MFYIACVHQGQRSDKGKYRTNEQRVCDKAHLERFF